MARLYLVLAENRVTRMPWAVVQTYSRAQGSLLSGSVAYFTFLSLLPLLMVTGFVVGTLSSSSADFERALGEALDRVFPGVGGTDVLNQLVEARVAFGVLGLVTVAYAGSGFVGALTACLNQMWGVEQGRNPMGQKILNVLAVIFLGVLLIGSSGLTLWAAYLARTTVPGNEAWIMQGVELVASPLAIFLELLLLYRMLPARPLSWRSQLPGAVLGAAGIELLKWGFAYWARHSAGVGALPRSLLSVVLLLVWLGFFGQVILYGAALNVSLHRRRATGSPFPGGWHHHGSSTFTRSGDAEGSSRFRS